MLRLGLPPAALIEGYRRMVFNVLAVNQDDHVKNFSIHLNREGEWSLTPAYDLTFAKGGTWTATHQMRVAGKRSGITHGDLVGVGREFGIRAPAGIIGEVRDAVARWPEFPAHQELPREVLQGIGTQLARRAEETAA